jgi:hypothetical protein
MAALEMPIPVDPVPLRLSHDTRPGRGPTQAIAREITEDSKLRASKDAPGVSATYVPQWACPTTCAFLNSGCYTESGPISYVTGRLNASGPASPEDIARAEADKIRELSGRYPLRLHVIGDSKTDEAAAIVADASAEYASWRGAPVWTYTHAWRTVDRASWGNVSVLASCETEQDVRDATARGYATALVWDSAAPLPPSVGGTNTLQCLQQSGRAPDCARCGNGKPICARDTSLRGRATIVFMAHGNTKRVKAALASR